MSPAPPVATTAIRFSPSMSVTFALQASVPFAGSPFAVTDASAAVPATVIVEVWVVGFGAHLRYFIPTTRIIQLVVS